MELTILHLYPDCMSLYGEYANVAVLRRHLEAMRVSVRVDTALFEDTPDFSRADFIDMGAGAERTQKAALSALLPHREALKAAVDRGAVVLFTGSAMELLGASITGADGRVWPCLGFADFTTRETGNRSPEDVVARASLWESFVVGFMNKCSETFGVAAPLFDQVERGPGPGGPRLPGGGLCGRQCVRHPPHRPHPGEEPGLHRFPHPPPVPAQGLAAAGTAPRAAL